MENSHQHFSVNLTALSSCPICGMYEDNWLQVDWVKYFKEKPYLDIYCKFCKKNLIMTPLASDDAVWNLLAVISPCDPGSHELTQTQ